MKMNDDSGSSLLTRTSSLTKSYGATNSRMLTVIDSKMLTHTLQPTDTLQGLAVKYGVTVEKLKRVNKLWSNESILTRDTLSIPSEDGEPIDDTKHEEPTSTAYVKPETQESYREHRKRSVRKSEELGNSTEALGSDGELGSSWKENENAEQFEKQFNEILSNADKAISEHKKDINMDNCSEGYKAFNAILLKIDDQIETHKNKHQMDDSTLQSPVPEVGYGTGYQSSNPAMFSPTSQHHYLEQGI